MNTIEIKREIAENVNKQLIEQDVIDERSGEITTMYGDMFVYCGFKRLKKSELLKIVNIMDASMSLWSDDLGMYIRIM